MFRDLRKYAIRKNMPYKEETLIKIAQMWIR